MTDCAVTYTIWVTQRRDSTTSPLSSHAIQSVRFAHDSGCAEENVTRLSHRFRTTIRIDTIDKCEMR